jgi:F-box-like
MGLDDSLVPRLADFGVRLLDPTSDNVARYTLERLNALLIEKSEVEEELERIESVAGQYRNKLKNLRDKIYLNRAVLAPVRKLPLEVLTIIFGFLVATSPDDLVQVGLVCTQWRKATFPSELWANIIVSRETPRFMKKVILYEERSKPCKLRVSYTQSKSLDGLPSLLGPYSPLRWKAWVALMLTADRWISLALTFDDCLSASSQIPRLKESLDLEELSVTIRRQSQGAAHEGDFGFENFDTAKMPSLRSLTILTHILPRPGLLFTKLTHLHLTDTFYSLDRPMNGIKPIPGQRIIGVLRSCPNLEDFSFNAEKTSPFVTTKDMIADQSLVAELPKLRRLHLICHYTVGYALLRTIDTYNVEDVALRLFPRDRSMADEPSVTAGEFVARCPQIRTLSLYGLNPQALLRSALLCFQRPRFGLQLLERLHLEHVSELNMIATCLNTVHQLSCTDEFWFIPRLSTLIIVANWFDVNFDEFAMVIKGRYKTNQRSGETARIQKYVVNNQDLLDGAAPGEVVSYKRPERFQQQGNLSSLPDERYVLHLPLGTLR